MKKALLSLLLLMGLVYGQTVGKRPYEMDWAGRTEDDHRPLVDFERNDVWTMEATNGEAIAERSREQQMFGDYVLKFSYKGAKGGASFILRPPQPLPVPADFDAISLWAYGHKFAFRHDAQTAGRAELQILFKTPDGKEQAVHLVHVKWDEWFLCHIRLTDEQQKLLHQPGTVFSGIKIANCRTTDERTLYFDSLCLYKEDFAPLFFAPRAKRGIDLFPGQDAGINTGEGRLPFPTREDTILPDSAAEGSSNSMSKKGQGAIMRYEGKDGKLTVRYEPQTGTWGDLTAQWNDGPSFQPLADGGARFGSGEGFKPDKAEFLGGHFSKTTPKGFSAAWKLFRGDDSFEVLYTFTLRGKTLVVDTMAKNESNLVGVVSYGSVKGLSFTEKIEIPYYDYASGRPAVVLAQSGATPLFLSGHTDWYLSNGSRPRGAGDPRKTVQFNGYVEYIPKTDGKRNDVYERFFVTISPVFEETLPNIPNPKSPWKHVTGTGVWRAYGAGNREADKKYWYNIWRHGMRHCIITDHETGWRDGEESFTFRTRPAPGKGGDEGQYDYARYMQDTLGFVYGPYNNFTDFAPVNEYWSTDMVARDSRNQLMHAWRRCYAPKPLRAVEYAEKLPPIIQNKFHFSTAYCDVHTSVTPWSRCDYDYRVPGAGTFAQVFYAFGEIMLMQKKAWNGPVYSEGPHFCFYSGLTDGNYAQDRTYRLPDRPWLVDFDLNKIHDQECNFGIGSPAMFYEEGKPFGRTPDELEMCIDRFLAATVAFGHPGFLVGEGGMRMTMRSYFLVQQLAARYTQASVASIRYADSRGRLWPTSEALVNQCYKRSQLVVDYDNGTHVVVNGSKTEEMRVKHLGRDIILPPNGFEGWTDDGMIHVFSGARRGQRVDYAETPEYIYIDGRDRGAQRFAKASGAGAAVCRVDDADHYEIIPWGTSCCGFAVEGGGAKAIAHDGTELGDAKTVRCRGLLYVLPVENAVSYKIDRHVPTRESKLTSEQYEVVSGSDVIVHTPDGDVTVTITGKPGECVWYHHDGESICFMIREMTHISVALSKDERVLECTIFNNANEPLKLDCALNGASTTVLLPGDGKTVCAFALPEPQTDGVLPLQLELTSGKCRQSWKGGLLYSQGPDILRDDFFKTFQFGFTVDGHPEMTDGGVVHARAEVTDCACDGIVKPSIFMHPPWWGGVHGNTFTTHDITLPKEPVFFRAMVGKRDGSDFGDGIRFQVAIIYDGHEMLLAQHPITKHVWEPIEADLTPWAGKKVTLKLISDIGEARDTAGDWACWADIHLERPQPRIITKLDGVSERYDFEALPDYVAGLAEADLRSAVKAVLKYRGQGLDSNGGYTSYAWINGKKVGQMVSASGNERDNVWSDFMSVEIPPEIIATLKKTNRFELDNPGEDFFKVKDFHLELTLADGRKVTSLISRAIYSQPAGWAYSEGVKVPFEERIAVLLCF